MAQNRLPMTFLFSPCYDIITWAGQDLAGQKSDGVNKINKATVQPIALLILSLYNLSRNI